MVLTEPQKEALVLIYMLDHDAIVPSLGGEIDQLVALGLANGPAGQWAVTPTGRTLAEQLSAEA
jgi:hypothetical protein